MDENLVSSLMPLGQDPALACAPYFLPHDYHWEVVGSIQPPAASLKAQAKRTIKNQFSTVQTGQPRNRWRAHKKETCQCAVCKQVRGELSSTWFKHDKANCKCSVCRQARGEKRSPKKIASGEVKTKTSLISNRVRRLAGKSKISTSESNSTAEKVADSAFSSEVKHLTPEESSEELLNVTSCLSGSQLNSDRIFFSWRCKSSLAMSESESCFESPSQALDALSFSHGTDLIATKAARSSFDDSALDISGFPSSQTDMDGTTKRTTVSGSQIDKDSMCSVGSGGPSVTESNNALPCLLSIQISDYISTSNSVDLAMPLVSQDLHITLQRASSVSLRKRNRTCNLDKSNCGCDGCMRNTSSNSLCGTVMTDPWISSSPKRRRIVSHSIDSIRAFQERLHSVCPLFGKQKILFIFELAIREYGMAFQSYELTDTKLQLLLLGQRDKTGSHCSPATTCKQYSFSLGTCFRFSTSSLEQDASRSKTASSWCWQKLLLGILASSGLKFRLDQAGQKPHTFRKGVVMDLYRNLLKVMEQGRSIVDQHCAIKQQRIGDKRKHAYPSFDGAVQPHAKQRKFFCIETQDSKVSTAIRRWIPDIFGYFSTSTTSESSKHGVLQSRSHGKLATGNKWKHASSGFDKAAQHLSERRRVCFGETQLLEVSPAICRWTPRILVSRLTFGPSKHGALQLSVFKSHRGLVNTGQSNLPSEDNSNLCVEVQKFDGYLSRRFERRNKDNRCSRSTVSKCYAAVQGTDSSCQRRAVLLSSGRVRETAQNHQDQCSVLYSGLSFQDLLSSVSQNVAVPLLKTSRSVEHVLVSTRSCTKEKCDGSTPLEAPKLRSTVSTCIYGEESRTRDPSYKQLQNTGLSRLHGYSPSLHIVEMVNSHEDQNLTRDIPSLSDVSHDCESPKSKGKEDSPSQYFSGCSEDYISTGEQCTTHIIVDLEETNLVELLSLSPGVQGGVAEDKSLLTNTAGGSNFEDLVPFLVPATLSTPVSPSCKTDNIAAVDNHCTSTEHPVITKICITEQHEFSEVEVLQTDMLLLEQKREFVQKLKAVLEKPFDTLELEELEKCVSVRKPQMRLRESRHETRHVPLRKEGFSYLEHYPDFRKKFETINVPEDKLKLLRGFFVWIQHTCMSGAFMPWEEIVDDDDCLQIIEEKCTAIKQLSAESCNQTKKDRLGGAAKWSRPASSMHMSLRARKKVVYTCKTLRRKEVAKQPATMKVKIESN